MNSRRLAALAAVVLAIPTSASAALLAQTSPVSVAYTQDVDFMVFNHSGIGDKTAPVTAVDLQLGLGNASTSGCEASDFAGFTIGNIALIQRGTCLYELKAENAAAAGAVGVLLFNQGNTNDPTRQDVLFGNLTDGYTGGIPVLGLSYDFGVGLASTGGLAMRMAVSEEDLARIVPEPAGLSLFAIGVVALAAARWGRYRTPATLPPA